MICFTSFQFTCTYSEMYLLSVLKYRFITHSIACLFCVSLYPTPLHETFICPGGYHKKPRALANMLKSL